jgi:hypothetical protein
VVSATEYHGRILGFLCLRQITTTAMETSSRSSMSSLAGCEVLTAVVVKSRIFREVGQYAAPYPRR